DPRMLPVESIRFFYVDPGWIQALTAGALSLAIHGSSDAALHAALLPGVLAAVERHRRARFHRTRPDAALPAPGDGAGMTGVLIRSQVVSGWPSMVITGTVGGAPLNIVRDDRPAPSVRLVLFEGTPDTVTLAEPYQGLLFGVEDEGVYPRCVTSPSFTGSQIANGSPVKPSLRTPPAGVLEVQATAGALELAVGITSFAKGAVVRWNGSALATTYVGPHQLSATVPARLVASAGTSSVTVVSDGATSPPVTFTIDAPLQIDAVAVADVPFTTDTARPTVGSLRQSVARAGGGSFSLAVDGVHFGAGAVVQWNDTPLTPTSSSAEQLVVTVPASLVESAGSASITVRSNGVTSNALPFAVLGPQPAVGLLSPSSVVAGTGDFTLIVTGGFGAGDLALQLVAAPERQSFPTT